MPDLSDISSRDAAGPDTVNRLSMLADDRPGAGRPEAGDVVMSARALSKQYGPFRAVSDVDLDIREHDIHVFIGPNGAGKSTVLNMLGGQILPSTGEVF